MSDFGVLPESLRALKVRMLSSEALESMAPHGWTGQFVGAVSPGPARQTGPTGNRQGGLTVSFRLLALSSLLSASPLRSSYNACVGDSQHLAGNIQ